MNFQFDEKIDENRKFEILNPKIKNLTKSQNLKSLTLKSKIFNFDKICPKNQNSATVVYHNFAISQNSMVKIFQNWSQYGVTTVTRFFQNFEVDIKITKISKLALITKILKKILKTRWPARKTRGRSWKTRNATRGVPLWNRWPSPQPETRKKIVLREILDFGEIWN